MKRTHNKCILLVFLLCAFRLSDDAMFKVIRSRPDRSLKENEASFDLHFEDSNGSITKSDIHVTYNGTEKRLTPDKKGNATCKVKPGDCYLTFFYNEDHYTVKTDTFSIEAGHCTTIDVTFRSSVVIMVNKNRKGRK
jgi:hypothetical protein